MSSFGDKKKSFFDVPAFAFALFHLSGSIDVYKPQPPSPHPPNHTQTQTHTHHRQTHTTGALLHWDWANLGVYQSSM